MIKYDKDVIKILKKSEEEMFKLKDNCVDIKHLILATLKTENNIKKLLNKYGITYESYKSTIEKTEYKINYIFYSYNLKKILDSSYDIANKYSSNEITLEHIYIAILEDNIDIGIDNSSIYKELVKSLNNTNSVISELGIDLTRLAKENKLNKTVGRESEIKEIIKILARKNKNNPILVGDAGVGKTAIIEELATMISNKNIPKFLENKKIISLSISSVISGTKYRGEFEDKLNKILNECENNNNIILFIDEIHTIVGAGGAEGAIDASNILKPVLARGNIKIIGATTLKEYEKYIQEDKALDRRFQKVYIKEPTIDETYNILKNIKSEYEQFHNVNIDNKVLKKIVDLSDKYILDRYNPDKSIDILDEACAETNIYKDKNKLNNILKTVQSKKSNLIKNKDFIGAKKLKEEEQELIEKINNKPSKINIETVIKIIESKCNSKIYDLNNDNFYTELENNLNKKIIGEKEEIKKIINTLKILKDKKDNMPISFLITGPQGTGKTSIAIELAKLLNKNLIKLDMYDYSNEMSITKITGSPQGYVGYNDNNTSLNEIRIKPNSIILLDEIDKAHPSILNLFSNILSNGTLKNSKNEIMNFKNSIIIMTSNNSSYNTIGYLSDSNSYNNLPKDFINKITRVINFKKLNIDSIKIIVNKCINIINSNYNMDIKLNENDVNNLIKESEYEIYGANKIQSLLKSYIEKMLITYTN